MKGVDPSEGVDHFSICVDPFKGVDPVKGVDPFKGVDPLFRAGFRVWGWVSGLGFSLGFSVGVS